MKSCSICDTSLGFTKFKFEEGYLCKDCYEKASRHFTQTIRHKSLGEIEVLCSGERTVSLDEEFEVNRRVANYILFDDAHKKICIPHNRAVARDFKQPEIYDYHEIAAVSFLTQPQLTKDELLEIEKKQTKMVMGYLAVKIDFKGKKKPCTINLFTTPVRTTSYAYKRAFTFAKNILTAVEKLTYKN